MLTNINVNRRRKTVTKSYSVENYVYILKKQSWNNNLATIAKSENSATNKNLTKLPNSVQTK